MEEEQTLSMLERLDWDTARHIIRLLIDPADIIRFASVSRSCRRVVVESKCTKELCIRFCPEVSKFSSVVEEDKMNIYERPCSSKDGKWASLKRKHRIYGMLARELMAPPAERSCICEPISASSTDNYPEESIINTLDPTHTDDDMPCYWSSKGESSKDAPETLTYALCTDLCVVHEVNIHPFRAHFQIGDPIYSANAVRFRFGYSSSSSCEDYVWTYVSPMYPMQQEDKLQTFKLPRPVLCMGGILQVELLGRVQKQEMDGLYYICVCHVHVVGRPLSFFNFEVLGQSSNFILKYSEMRGRLNMLSEETSTVTAEDDVSGTWHSIAERIRQIRAGRVLTMLSNIGVVNFINPNDQDSVDEDSDDNQVIF